MDQKNSGDIEIPSGSLSPNETNKDNDTQDNVMDVIGNGQLIKKVRQFSTCRSVVWLILQNEFINFHRLDIGGGTIGLSAAAGRPV